MGAGFEATLRQTGTDDSVIVMQAGAQSELNSAVTPETVALVSQAPQVLKNAEERSIVSPELVLTAMLQNKGGHDANVVIRGVGERAWDLWPHVRIAEGRKFTPGLQELIVTALGEPGGQGSPWVWRVPGLVEAAPHWRIHWQWSRE